MELGFFFLEKQIVATSHVERWSTLSFLASGPKRHPFTLCPTQDPDNHTGTLKFRPFLSGVLV